MSTLFVNQYIEAKITAEDSYYSKVKGSIEEIEYNKGRVLIQAKKVVSKFSNEWREHPTSCAIYVRIDNIINYKFSEENKLILNKLYTIPSPVGGTFLAEFKREDNKYYHFDIKNKGWESYPGYISKKDIDTINI